MNVRKRGEKSEWRILLADDDDYYAMIIERALKQVVQVPLEIRRARTGDEALSVLEDFVPDLLLLDLKIPGMAGHDALEVIKADDRLRSVPVAILPSSDRDDDVAKRLLRRSGGTRPSALSQWPSFRRLTVTMMWPRVTDSAAITTSRNPVIQWS